MPPNSLFYHLTRSLPSLNLILYAHSASHRPGTGPGPHGIPADIEYRAPLPHLVAAGLADRIAELRYCAAHGTLLAVLIYFARDWVQIVAQGFGIQVEGDSELKHNHMLLWLLAIGTVPVGIAGLLFNKQAESTGATRS